LVPDSGRLSLGMACWIVTFCFNTLSEDGNPVPKRVELCFIICILWTLLSVFID